MIFATDVDYQGERGRAAVIGFHAWEDATAAFEETEGCRVEAEYRPGAFFERELPCILPLIQRLGVVHRPRVIVVDGYVELGTKPGLGAHLGDALLAAGLPMTVVGVAKNPFRGAPAVEVRRGASDRPLFVSARGVALDTAASWVRQMHGPHRMPTLLRRVDGLARGRAEGG